MDERWEDDARRARSELEAGSLRGAALLERLRSVPGVERDAWVDAVLALGDQPLDAPLLPRGSAPYLPCGVEEVLAFMAEAPLGPSDEFVDLGSGLGRVVLLVNLLSGARARGIEIQRELVARATARTRELRLDGVSFLHGNAAELDLDGSIFFLYAPFHGEMLKQVLRRLERVAQKRPILVAAVALELAGVAWLSGRATALPSLVLYASNGERFE